MLPDWGLFFLTWLHKPLDVASLVPSSPWVAAEVARQMQLDREGRILELGAGTGSVTGGLLKGGCPPERLVLIEREPIFADVLRCRFGNLTVIEGDAVELGELLAARSIGRLASVISALPIKWFPEEAQRRIIDQSFDLMGPGGHFVQITNRRTSPLPADRFGLAAEKVAFVWRNLLPMYLWIYRPKEVSGNRLAVP